MPTEDSRYMEPLQLAGRMIMENGGETYRVEETITRMGRAFGLERVDCFAVPSGLFISYRRQDGGMETSVTRVHRGSRRLNRVDEVNAISRQVEREGLGWQQALQRLQAIEKAPPYVTGGKLIAAAAACAAGFTGMFGGTLADIAISGAVAALVELLSHGLERLNLKDMMATLLGSFFSTLLPMLAALLGVTGNAGPIVGGALMPLLPGLAMTNAVQDALRGDMVSGLSHGLSAVLTAVLVAGGALVASALVRLMGGVPA